MLSYYGTVYTLRIKRKSAADDWTKRLCTGRTVFSFQLYIILEESIVLPLPALNTPIGFCQLAGTMVLIVLMLADIDLAIRPGESTGTMPLTVLELTDIHLTTRPGESTRTMHPIVLEIADIPPSTTCQSQCISPLGQDRVQGCGYEQKQQCGESANDYILLSCISPFVLEWIQNLLYAFFYTFP